jgi:hypothetical protein
MRNSSCYGFCAGVFLCGSEMGRAVGFLTMTAAHNSRFVAFVVVGVRAAERIVLSGSRGSRNGQR